MGGGAFVKAIKDTYLTDKPVDRDVRALRELSQRPSIEEIDREVELILGEDRSSSRRLKPYLCHRYTGKKVKDIGTYFDIGESGVS